MDAGSWDQIYQDEAPFLGRVLYKMTGDPAMAEDLLQEVFVVALEKRAHYDPDKGAPGAWLYGIARLMCLRRLRDQRRFFRLREQVVREPAPEFGDSPEQDAERAERALRVQRVLSKLPAKQREVLVLFELEDKDGDEVARLLSIPQGTVWTRLHHARKGFLHLWRKQREMA